jgi:hypothetical protein
MARDVEHFFMCVLANWISSFEKTLFSYFAHFFIGSLILGEFSFLSYLYALVIKPLSVVYLAKIFSHSMSCLFTLVPFLLAYRCFLFSCNGRGGKKERKIVSSNKGPYICLGEKYKDTC